MTTSIIESASVPARVEWARIPAAVRASGIGRSTMYDLIKEQKVKSAVIRNRGNVRGIRLVNLDSLMHYIESQAI